MGSWRFEKLVVRVIVLLMVINEEIRGGAASQHDYGDALTKSILFFEGQRSGKLPPTQRLTWRKDSALLDGFQIGVSLSLPSSSLPRLHK